MDRSMLNKATSADETPTPGYMYGEIAKSTFGDLAACQQLADYLLKKLERDNPHVKVKCLRIIRHVCDSGKGDFRRAVQKKADMVKQCLQYRGTPDTLKGDAYNKAVREEADSAIKSVFASDSSTNAYGMSNDASKKMQGFGSESAPTSFSGGGGGGTSFGSSSNTYGAGSGGGGGGGPPQSFGSAGGMVGFGNPNFNNAAPSTEENAYLKSAKAFGGDMFNKIQSKVQGASGQSGSSMPGYSNNMGSETSSYRAPNMNMQSVGGGLGTGMQGRWGGDSQPQRGAPPPPSSSTSTGDYEAKVVNEICAPGGPRVAPSPQALEEFCRKCESLDAQAVGAELRKKLEDQSWQTRLKALHAIEALHDKGLEGVTGHVSQFSSELLFECQEMPQCKAKAAKVLYLLGMGEEPGSAAVPQRAEAPAPAAAPAPAPAACMDLLDMGGDDLLGSAPPAPAQSSDLLGGGAPQASAQPAPSLLGDFGAPAAAPAAMPDMLGGSSLMPTQAPAPMGGGGGSLFGSLSMTSAPQTAAEPPSLLAGLQAASPLAQTAPAYSPPVQPAPADGGLGGLGGMFSGLAMGNDTPATASAPANGLAPAPAAAQPSGPMDASRGGHLGILGGGSMPAPGPAGPMGQSSGMMNGGPMMMQQGPMGQPNPMGMQMGQQQMGPGPAMGQGMMSQGMMGQPNGMMGQPNGMMGQPNGMMGQPNGMMGGGMMGQPNGMMGQPNGMMAGGMMGGGMGMGMGMQQQPQMGMGMGMQQQPMGMGGMGMMQQQPMGMGGYGGNMGMAGNPGMMSGQAPGSAFNFIGGNGNAAGSPGAQALNSLTAANDTTKTDSAFSFVADEIRGARS